MGIQSKDLLSIDDLSKSEIEALYAEMLDHEKSGFPLVEGPVALVFAERSTRTRISFERAAQDLKRPVIYLGPGDSSLGKGESLWDTLANLHQYADDGLRTFVLRAGEGVDFEQLRDFKGIRVISGGLGVEEHPTQALTDLFSLFSQTSQQSLDGFRLAIVGDLKHSRVFGSWRRLASKMGIKLSVLGPEEWLPESSVLSESSVEKLSSKSQLSNFDAVMALRVQKERFSASEAELKTYIDSFQITQEDLAPKTLLMHPGPVNWGIELAENCGRAATTSGEFQGQNLILKQAQMGFRLRRQLLATFF